jgi:hypothetical protein
LSEEVLPVLPVGPLPQGRHVGDYIQVGNAFRVSLFAAVFVAVSHTVAAARTPRRAGAG